MNQKELVIDYTAVKALDMLIAGGELQEVLSYLYFNSIKYNTFISSYLCKMTYRLALLNLDTQTRSRVYDEIILLAEKNERNLYNEI